MLPPPRLLVIARMMIFRPSAPAVRPRRRYNINHSLTSVIGSIGASPLS